MSPNQVYPWQQQVRQMFPSLGYWQVLTLALYSLAMLMGRHSGATRAAEGLGQIGKPESLRRRFERFIANPRLDPQTLCQQWSRWVLTHLDVPQPVLLVDETRLGNRLRVMVVGVAYHTCCIPLAFYAYQTMPQPQVALILTLLGWIDAVLPPDCCPLLQADRGIGTSPELIRGVERLGWHFLFRVQNDTHLSTQGHTSRPLKQLVKRGECWRGRGLVFKKAGWLPATVLVVWDAAYAQPWCLVTNAPYLTDFAYAVRYWQEASFRDLKSDGWQWQTSRVWRPDHAQRLLLVMALAYAYTLTFGLLVLNTPDLFIAVARPGKRQHYSLFRLGLRLVACLRSRAHLCFPPLFAPSLSPPVLCVGV